MISATLSNPAKAKCQTIDMGGIDPDFDNVQVYASDKPYRILLNMYFPAGKGQAVADAINEALGVSNDKPSS